MQRGLHIEHTFALASFYRNNCISFLFHFVDGGLICWISHMNAIYVCYVSIKDKKKQQLASKVLTSAYESKDPWRVWLCLH